MKKFKVVCDSTNNTQETVDQNKLIVDHYHEIDVEKELARILAEEIVRETLLQVNPETDDALVDKMWKLCDGNPWNAVPLYEILKLSGKL